VVCCSRFFISRASLEADSSSLLWVLNRRKGAIEGGDEEEEDVANRGTEKRARMPWRLPKTRAEEEEIIFGLLVYFFCGLVATLRGAAELGSSIIVPSVIPKLLSAQPPG